MAIPQSSNGMGNLLRLAGLKNVSGRRKVLPGAEFLEDLDAVDTDVSGTSQMPLPENTLPETEGGALAQSYDVRANEILPEQNNSKFEQGHWKQFARGEPNQGNFWESLGGALSNYANKKNQESSAVAQTPPIETQQTDLQEGLPPVSASQEEHPNNLARIGKWFKESFTPKLSPEFPKQFPEAAEQLPQFQPQIQQQKQLDQEQLNAAQQNPWQIAVYGATDQLANSPELVRELEEYAGIDFSPETKAITEKYEKVMSDIENGVNAEESGYDAQAKRIEQRILSNQATDMDKYYIGLALLMPLALGGFLGAEAGIGALGGAAKGIADIYGNRAKNIQADEELLADINKQKGTLSNKRNELKLESLKFPAELKKLLPKDEYEDLKGMQIVTYKDTSSGEVIAAGPQILPDFVADISYYNTDKKRAEAAKKASKLSEEKAALQRANDATRDVVKAALQLENPGIVGQMLAAGLSSDENGTLKKLYKQNAPTITIDGRKVNSAVYLDSKLEQIKDAYRRNEQMKAFTNTIANHVGAMAENPQYSGLTPEDLITQMLILRDRGQQFFIDRATGQGFLPQPFTSLFGKENRELYGNLNKKEEKSAIESDKQKLLQSG